MLNQPLPRDWTPPPTRLATWEWDAAPGSRLAGLGLLLLIPLVVIAVRIADLQCRQQAAYLDVFSQTHPERQELPARDGRILAADGAVLADDVIEYELHVRYRWLEQPPDPAWLRRRAWERLNRSDRRKPAQVAAQEALLRQEAIQWWRDLARLTDHSEVELRKIARGIQDQVDHVWATVDERRRAQPAASTQSVIAGSWWECAWQSLQKELAQPPTRTRQEPLVIQEQEQSHRLLAHVSAEIAAEVRAHPDRYPGVSIVDRPRRVYPQHERAAHLLGVRTPLREEELSSLGKHRELRSIDYRAGDPLGRSGLERQYERVLHGRRGVEVLTRNRHGEVVSSVIERPAEHGRDLVLTIDLPLQQRAEELLDAALMVTPPIVSDDDQAPTNAPQAPPPGACLIAIDVQTGALLTAASAPRYDANLLVRPETAVWQKVLADPRKPLFHRAAQMALPPGSVYKAVSAIALLESETFEPHQTIFCQGYLDHPGQHRCLTYRHYGVGHGETDLAAALARSCNVYFFTGARRAGPQVLVDWSQRLGIGQPTGLDLPGETAGVLPSPAQPNGAKRWYPGDTLGLAIGQSSLMVTPLQMARVMAAIANGGLLVTPHLATSAGPTSIDTASGSPARPVFDHPAPQPIPGLHPETLLSIRAGLDRVVQDPQGTGYKTVRLREVAIAGKTGTAETGSGRPDHAWFAGYAPADNPRVAFAVVVEHGGSGGKVAGPIARDFVRKLLETGLITPSAPLAGQ